MTMRRLTGVLIAISCLGVASLMIARSLPCTPDRVIARRIARAITRDLASRGTRWVTHGGAVVVGSGGSIAARAASAEEVLPFRRVPAESLSSLETRVRRHRIVTTPASPEPPEPSASEPSTSTPEPPTTIVAPEESTVVFGKSGNVMRIGSDVHVLRDQVVSGDLVVVGGDITVEGHVEGDAVSLGGDVHLSNSARVDGDVAAIGGTLSEDPGASVGGQRVTAGGGRALRRLGHGRRFPSDAVRGVAAAGHVASSVVWLLIALVVGWGFAQIAPGKTGAALATLRREPAVSIGIGGLIWALMIPSLVALCLVVAILCLTIIGMPLGIAALLGYGVFLGLMFVWGYAVAAAGVGEWVLKRRTHSSLGASGVMMTPEPSLTHKAVVGVLVISGSGLVGQVLQTLFFAPPLQGLGTFIAVVSIVAGGLATTFGAGAWLRTEITTGTLSRWWGGRKSGGAQPAPMPAQAAPAWPSAPPSAPSYAPPPPSPPPPPPPPSPPSAFAPPGMQVPPPPAPPAPGTPEGGTPGETPPPTG
jgi:hypothetical protein